MRFSAVVNPHAGSAHRLGRRGLEALLRGRLGRQLSGLRFASDRKCAAASRELSDEHPDALLVIGGDGTCRTVAAAVMDKNVPLVFLPGGTMNVLPRKIWGNLSLDGALAILGEGRVQETTLDIGLANGQPFFVAAAFGLLPRLTTVRENVRRELHAKRYLRALGWLAHLPHSVLQPGVRFSQFKDGPYDRCSGLIAAVSDAEVVTQGRAVTEADALECVSIKVQSWLGLARILLKAMMHRDWRADEKVDAFHARTLFVAEGRDTWVTLDGERQLMKGVIEIGYRGRGIATLGPAPARAATRAAA